MNKALLAAIFSKSQSGIKIIQGLPTNPTKALSIYQLAKKIGISSTTTYRIMQKLIEWPNIISFEVPSKHRPFTLYYIKSKQFVVNFTKKGVEVTA